MKKLLAFLLAILFLLTLISCGEGNDATGTDESDAVDTDDDDTYEIIKPPVGDFIYSAGHMGVLYRYDVIGRRATVACPDPLCTHGQDCLYSLVESFYVYGNLCFYVRDFSTLYKYSPADSVAKLIYEAQGDIVISGAVGDYLYFCASIYEFDEETGQTSSEKWDLYRYSMNEDSVIKLNDEKLSNHCKIIECTNEKILWSGNASDVYFETDYDYKNITETSFSIRYVVLNGKQNIDGYGYRMKMVYDESGNRYSLAPHRINFETEKEEILITGTYDCRFLPDRSGFMYIPYTGQTIDFSEIMNDESYSSVDVTNELWIADLDGSGAYKLCDIPSDIYVASLNSTAGNRMTAADYRGVYMTYTKDYGPHSLWIVNLKTGENFVLTP